MPESAAEASLLKRRLEEAVAADPSSPFHHYNLGVFLWNRAETKVQEEEEEEEARRLRAAAAEHFLSAAKLNPNDGVAFRFLGHHYARGGDAQRAAKCYQRAVALNPDDAEAGEGLCDLLDVEGKESLQLAVCKEAADKSPRAFWALRRLGYLQVRQRKWSEAIQSLQHAIRGYPTCADLWEALGLAYHRLGMFTAAVKSYGRAIELDSSKVFALIESGNIQLMLGYFRKGVEQFRSALEMAPQNLSAYFGLASALLAWARHCVNSGSFGWGATLLKEALEAAKVCTSLAGNLSCVWKLNGDVQIAFARCFPWDDGKNNDGLDEQLFKASILEWKNTCLLAANGAKLSYQRALHLTPWEANIHNDTAISLDLIYSLEESGRLDPTVWDLPEKMSLGGLILEPVNKEIWVTLGSVSSNHALKQHSFIRALQLDMSLSEAWAYLGKIYRNSDEKQFARQAFDHARSIDPSLALPWAGMSSEYYHHSGRGSVNESFESCLRAVQILPVLVAVRQAVQRAPHYPESHNINGLVHEARSDYHSAITSYRQARFALKMCNSKSDSRSHSADVSFNVARSLCKAGLATDAVRECEELKTQGILGVEGLQIYGIALWKLGRHEEALSVARDLAENFSSMKQESATVALGLICTLTYRISGKDPAAAVIHKLPGQLIYSTQLKFIISALDALQPNKRFQLPPLSMPPKLTSYDVMSEVHSNIALGKMMGEESNKFLRVDVGLSYLKKTLHMYPNCSLVRNQLGSLLLCSGDWMASHKAGRITVLSHQHQSIRGLKSPHQIQASATVSCYATCTLNPRFSFPTCQDQYLSEHGAICYLQRLVHQQPWNQHARYLLALAVFQKAREEKYPKHLCIILKRLISQVLSNSSNSEENKNFQYEKFLLLLLSSEVSLQSGNHDNCITQATEALRVLSSRIKPFFAHLQLCRAYAVQGDLSNSRNEYMKCLQTNTNMEIGWVMLKYLQSICSLECSSDEIEMNLKKCIEGKCSDSLKWASLFNVACAQCYILDEDYASAEKALAQACGEGDPDSCILLFHGATCMEIARRYAAPQFISRAASSLRKAQQRSPAPLPAVSLLLAQAEGSLGSKSKWERNLRLEWFSWPPEMRPAEVYFQMHLLARQSTAASTKQQQQLVETMHIPERWLLRAIHLNPSSSRYWKALLH